MIFAVDLMPLKAMPELVQFLTVGNNNVGLGRTDTNPTSFRILI
jgi:hypothetical protein